MYGLQEAVDREYSIINGEILIERHQANDSNIPWNKASSLHYEFNTKNDADKITMADAIFDGRDRGNIISKERIIQAAWTLINDYGIPKSKFSYMKNL